MSAKLITNIAIFSTLAVSAAAQDFAYPKFSPIPIYSIDEYNGELEKYEKLSVVFGHQFEIVQIEADTILIKLSNGELTYVKSSDVFIPSNIATVTLGPAYSLEGRVRLSFWDSQTRAEGFLMNGPMRETRPILEELEMGGLPDPLPITQLELVESRTGNTIQLAQGRVPINANLLNNGGSNINPYETQIKVNIIVDGSEYAKVFSQQSLQELSRQLDARDETESMDFYRTVILDNGNYLRSGALNSSGLRQLLPESNNTQTDSSNLTTGFISALSDVERNLTSIDNLSEGNVILLMLGSSIRNDVVTNPNFLQVVERLRRLSDAQNNISIILASVTPEPSETHRIIYNEFADKIPTTLLTFSDNINDELKSIFESLSDSQNTDKASLTTCLAAENTSLPCLTSQDRDSLRRLLIVPDVEDLEWFSLPLWYIVDGTTLAIDYNSVTQDMANSIANTVSVDTMTLAPSVQDHSEGIVTTLNTKVDRLETERDELLIQVNQIESELFTTKATLASSQIEADHTSNLIQQLNEELTALGADLDISEVKYEDQVQINSELLQELEEKQQEFSEANLNFEEEVANLNDNIEASDRLTDQLRQEIIEISNSYKSVKSEHDDIQAALNENLLYSDQLESEVIVLSRSLEQSETQKTDLEDEILLIREEIINQQYLIEELESTNTDLNNEINELSLVKDQLTTRARNMQNQITTYEEERNDLIGQLSNSENEISSLLNTLQGLQLSNRNQVDRIELLQNENTTLNQSLSIYRENNLALTETLARLDVTMNEQGVNILDLTNKLEETSHSNGQLIQELEILQRSNVELESTLVSREEQVRRLNSALDQQQNADTSNALVSIDGQDDGEDISQLMRENESYQEDLITAKNEVERLRATNQDLTEELAVLSVTLENVQSEQASGKAHLEAIISAVETDLVSSNEQLEVLMTRVLETETREADLNREMLIAESELVSKNRQLSELTKLKDEIRSENENLRSQLATSGILADDNLQLRLIIQQLESNLIERETVLLGELDILRTQVLDLQGNQGIKGNSPPEMAVVNNGVVLRPIARPERSQSVEVVTQVRPAATSDSPTPAANRPSRQAAPTALPGSLFVTSSGAGSANGSNSRGGFFSN